MSASHSAVAALDVALAAVAAASTPVFEALDDDDETEAMWHAAVKNLHAVRLALRQKEGR